MTINLQLDTRRILKRLAKENLKQLGRMVAKIAHANPMTVLRTIVHQVTSEDFYLGLTFLGGVLICRIILFAHIS